MENKEMEKLNQEELNQVAGGRALPESILKRFTRQEKEKELLPKEFTILS